ncbi:MAG: FliH/SctL family protein [bacterium]|nr:FliH/SctL family protein [candidate division KSB1 bacterium]MDH7559346.1 FliH/SctL family protein [bacterium]
MSKQIIKPGGQVRAVRATLNGHPLSVQIVPEAEGEAVDNVAQAYAKGFAEGKKLGEETARKQLGALLQQLEALVNQVVGQQQCLLREAEPTLVKIVMAVVQRVLKRELNGNSQYIEAMVRDALKYVHDSARVVVHVHPEDAAALRQSVDDLAASVDGLEVLELKEDPRLARGGFVLETDLGTIDARLEAQLDEIAHELEESLVGQS